MFTTMSGQMATAKQIDIIANNLANSNTTGFRAEHPVFSQVLTEEQSVLNFSSLKKDISPGDPIPTDQFGQMRGAYNDFSQGSIENTGNPLDAAIKGDGFFVINTTDGERYTRAGSFRTDPSGKVTTQSGDTVQGTGGDITVKGNKISINQDGSVMVDGAAVAKLRIVSFGPDDAKREAGQLFSMKEGATAQDIVAPQVMGGALETSNVNSVRELTSLIMASRVFESFKAASDQGSKMDDLVNQRVGSIQG